MKLTILLVGLLVVASVSAGTIILETRPGPGFGGNESDPLWSGNASLVCYSNGTGCSLSGGNASWTEARANALYYNKSNIWGYYNSSTLPASSGDGTGGWTNTSTTTNTSLLVNILNSAYVSGNITTTTQSGAATQFNKDSYWYYYGATPVAFNKKNIASLVFYGQLGGYLRITTPINVGADQKAVITIEQAAYTYAEPTLMKVELYATGSGMYYSNARAQCFGAACDTISTIEIANSSSGNMTVFLGPSTIDYHTQVWRITDVTVFDLEQNVTKLNNAYNGTWSLAVTASTAGYTLWNSASVQNFIPSTVSNNGGVGHEKTYYYGGKNLRSGSSGSAQYGELTVKFPADMTRGEQFSVMFDMDVLQGCNDWRTEWGQYHVTLRGWYTDPYIYALVSSNDNYAQQHVGNTFKFGWTDGNTRLAMILGTNNSAWCSDSIRITRFHSAGQEFSAYLNTYSVSINNPGISLNNTLYVNITRGGLWKDSNESTTSTNYSVGIGAIVPTQKLDIDGSIRIRANNFTITALDNTSRIMSCGVYQNGTVNCT